MQFLEQAQLENQPTEVLYQLADRLKERRTKLYPEEKMLNEGASSAGMDDDDVEEEFKMLGTDRKAEKSGEDAKFAQGSEKQLKNIGSSQVFDQNMTGGPISSNQDALSKDISNV